MNDKQLRDIFEDGCESVPVEESNGREMIELAGLRALAHVAWNEGMAYGRCADGRMLEKWEANPYNKEETK